MSDSINPNKRARSSRMKNATRSESPNSVPITVTFNGTSSFTGPVNFGTVALAVAEVSPQVLLILLIRCRIDVDKM